VHAEMPRDELGDAVTLRHPQGDVVESAGLHWR
jgi:hypothetical protein